MINPIVRYPVYRPIPVQQLVDGTAPPQTNVYVEECIGTRAKSMQRVKISKAMLWDLVMLAGLRTEAARLTAFGEDLYGKDRYLCFRVWDDKVEKHLGPALTVDYCFLAYKWEHAKTCIDKADHAPGKTNPSR